VISAAVAGWSWGSTLRPTFHPGSTCGESAYTAIIRRICSKMRGSIRPGGGFASGACDVTGCASIWKVDRSRTAQAHIFERFSSWAWGRMSRLRLGSIGGKLTADQGDLRLVCSALTTGNRSCLRFGAGCDDTGMTKLRCYSASPIGGAPSHTRRRTVHPIGMKAILGLGLYFASGDDGACRGGISGRGGTR